MYELKNKGQQVIDLEGLAAHKGSAFGSMNSMVQPTQEQFENNLAADLAQIDPNLELWIEDESITIGKRVIPNLLWRQMRDASVIVIETEKEKRVAFLVDEYGQLDKTILKECTEKIWKRLGPLQTKQALQAIDENRIADLLR